MTSSPDTPVTTGSASRAYEGPPLEAPVFTALRTSVATALELQAPAIAARWVRQSRGVALRDEADGSRNELREAMVAEALVRSLASALASDGATADDAVALGLAFGVEAFESNASLHHTLKGLDLLNAMTMYAVELASAEVDDGGSVADGVRLCRRLQQAASLVALAVTKGYTQVMGDGLRDRFRHLRHDLRNPLGTIKSVLALMDDETVPADARAHPRFRAMAERNARSLDELIMARLSDAAALLPSRTHQRVSLRLIACGVRRDLRAESEARDTTVAVADVRARVCVDAVNLELLLHTLLYAALQESCEGDELIMDFGDVTVNRATVMLTRASGRSTVSEPAAVDRITTLAAQMGATIQFGDTVIVTIPIRPDEPAPTPAPAS